MPISVEALMTGLGLSPRGPVRWGETVSDDEPGVYLVSVFKDRYGVDPSLRPKIDRRAVADLLARRPELTMDGVHPAVSELRTRFASFVVRGEGIQYIGMASRSVRKRVAAYYRTPLGARSPHAGGWFLKTLDGFAGFYVHWAVTGRPADAEDELLRAFVAQIPDDVRRYLRDPDRPFPFANLEYPRGNSKNHGIAGATGPRTDAASDSSADEASEWSPRRRRGLFSEAAFGPRYETQPVTAADKGAGRIRIPKRSKELFPRMKALITISLAGRLAEVRWDPRTGPDRERSGVVSTGRDLARTIPTDSRLRIIKEFPTVFRFDFDIGDDQPPPSAVPVRR